MISITLKRGKEQSLERFHPWIFSGAIARINGEPQEGDVVEVVAADGHFLCLGHYQIGSIAVRVLSFKPIEINQKFYDQLIAEAYQLRIDIGLAESTTTTAYRLVHGEGDGLPGLVIDIYNGTAVVQMHSVGMYRDRDLIDKALRRVMGDKLKAIYNKSEGTLPFKAALNPQNHYTWGKPDSKEAMENGLRFLPDWEKGQKTGFFVDQRENRALIERYAKGRNVLNMFCYTGGFSIYAMRGGANLVHSVDSSERAIELTNNNIELNFPGDARHAAFAQDAFHFMEQAKEKYDLIVLDPPAFAKHLNVLNNALKGYRRLNTKAIEMIEPGGILFTFSCSQVVSRDVFRTMVFTSAAKAGRRVSILHQLSQPADHPINIYHPEGEYLKGLVVRVY
ncbi:MAG: class I SAM-dependent rRNA methyltransferase [Bacteroidales bacterium]|jgi:23S rRNA (cytosine1962-C5)-methyltransferase|nr:class I SAM-dependent rRNA methyltransferase [Bacteroidales bacterium]